jgi:hypothetical protein
MRFFSTLIILTIMLLSCKHEIVLDPYTPRYSSEQLKFRLEKYFRINSSDSVEKFMNEWNKEISSSSYEYIHQNDTIANLFQVFYDLYKPYKFGNYEVEKYYDTIGEYFIIQTEIKNAVFSLDDYKAYLNYTTNGFPTDSLRDYFFTRFKSRELRPALSLDGLKCLYLTKEYRDAIDNFLLSEYRDKDSFEIMRVFIDDSAVYKRFDFLSPLFHIVVGHGGSGWYLETFPIVNTIIFDEKFEHGLVGFRSAFNGGVSDYGISKKNGHWLPDKNSIINGFME